MVLFCAPCCLFVEIKSCVQFFCVCLHNKYQKVFISPNAHSRDSYCDRLCHRSRETRKKLCSPTNVAKEICFLFANPDGRNFLNLRKWKKAKNVSSSPLTNSFCKLLAFLPATRVVCSCFRVKATRVQDL